MRDCGLLERRAAWNIRPTLLGFVENQFRDVLYLAYVDFVDDTQSEMTVGSIGRILAFIMSVGIRGRGVREKLYPHVGVTTREQGSHFMFSRHYNPQPAALFLTYLHRLMLSTVDV